MPVRMVEQTLPSRWMQFLLVALVSHGFLLAAVASVRFVVALPGITAVFEYQDAPLPKKELDPFVPLRDYEYVAGGGDSGTVIPPSYQATLLSPDARRANQTVGEIIGVHVGDAYAGFARLVGVPGSLGAPLSGSGGRGFGTGTGDGTGFGHRFGAKRAQAISQHKGAEEAERAVVAALRWLRDQQQDDGGWGNGKYRPGLSGLATLAFLGHGETPDSPEFGPTLNRAFHYLAANVNPQANMYEQAIVAYALAEGYGMTRSPSLREPLHQSVSLLLQAQQTPKKEPIYTGGWRYSILSDDSDTSVTGWCVQALLAARLAGVEVPQSVFDGASQFLWNMYRDGGFGYERPSASSSMTAIGVLCQAFLGHGNDPRMKEATDRLRALRFDWEKSEAPLGMVVYLWYYATQALFQAGGDAWKNWNEQFRDPLIRRQAEDGHWDLPAMSKEKEFNQPPVYSTALCALMLEVYYRYLPTYQQLDKGR